MKIKTLLLFLCLLISSVGYAQRMITVSGTVTDNDGGPLIGATIMEKSGKKAVITNLDGKFTMAGVTEGAVLTVSYLGFKSIEVNATAKEMNVILSEDVNQLNKAVVVGYGTIRKRDMTGSVVSVSSSEIENRMPTDIFEAMQGQVAGVQIVTNSGAPGEGAVMKVRGTSTFGDGAEPLYVVDGVPVESADMIAPGDIASIEILKDAASAAIYGSRSANGVVLITTKTGTPGKSRIGVKYQFSANQLANCIAMTTPEQFRYYDSVRQSLGQNVASTNTDPYNRFQNSGTNILDHLFQTALKHQAEISASGGANKIKYYAGMGLINEEGIISNTDYTKATMRLNISYPAAPFITIGHKVFASFASYDGLYSESSVLSYLYDWVPYWNIYDAEGNHMHNIENRNSALTYAMEAVNKTQKLNANMTNYAEVSIVKGLKFTSTLTGSFYMNRNQKYKPSILLGTTATDKTTGEDIGSYSYTLLNENYFNYSLQKDKHEFSAVLGHSWQYWRTDYGKTTGLDYVTDALYTLNFASQIKTASTTTTISEHAMLSFFTRATYSYAGKYLLAANVRADASSRFGRNNRWGYFPSASVGWRFSEEDFMEWSASFLHEGKIRASYGVTGNEAIGNYDSQMIYNSGNYYEGVSGVAPSRLGNPDLSWEKTNQVNLGLDLAFFDNRLSVVFDWYDKHTTDLLYSCQLPKETGFSTITRNVGAMRNQGFELAISANILRSRDWKWELGFNLSRNNSVILALADGVPFYTGSDSAIYVQEGARIGEFYGYKHDGIFQYDESNAFTEDWKQLTPVFSGGVFMHQYMLDGKMYDGTVYQKKYSDGTPFKGGDVNWLDAPDSRNGVIDTDDRVKIGCAQPNFFGGLNTTLSYKNLSLFVSLYYSFGGQIYNYARKVRNTFQRTYTSPEPDVIASMWTKPGDMAMYARPVSTVEYNRIAPSDFWIEDASYIKIRNIKLSYKLPRQWMKKAHLKDVTAFVYCNNPLTFTAYQGFDPEFSGANALSFGIDSGRYPRKREYGFGINVTL